MVFELEASSTQYVGLRCDRRTMGSGSRLWSNCCVLPPLCCKGSAHLQVHLPQVRALVSLPHLWRICSCFVAIDSHGVRDSLYPVIQ